MQTTTFNENRSRGSSLQGKKDQQNHVSLGKFGRAIRHRLNLENSQNWLNTYFLRYERGYKVRRVMRNNPFRRGLKVLKLIRFAESKALAESNFQDPNTFSLAVCC